MIPPMPSWNGLHPLVVHFPIALLLVAPILVVLSLLWRRQSTPVAVAALVIMAVGTASTFVAAATGEAAEPAAERIVAAGPVLDRHEELAETVRFIFLGLTLLYAAVAIGLAFFQRVSYAARVAATVVFLLLYAGGGLALANTAHLGGRLVHEFGIHAPVATADVTRAPGAVNPSPEQD